MPKKQPETEVPDPETTADLADAAGDFHAHLEPIEPSKFDRSPMEDPDHPLHHLRDA